MTHNPQGLAPDYHARVVVPMVQHIRCPNACTEPCDFPDCRRHQPQAAEAATEMGADDDRSGQGGGTLIWPAAVLIVALIAAAAVLL